jgi:hypothetical protein
MSASALLRTLSAGAVLLMALSGCGPEELQVQAGGIPAPPAGLSDASPIADFFAYADSLEFVNEGDSGSVAIQGLGAFAASRMVVRSELRTPLTDDSSYATGRITARIETTGANNLFGVPPSVGYLWVRESGGGHQSMIIWRANGPVPDSGKTATVTQLHLARTMSSNNPLAIGIDSMPNFSADTIRAGFCKRCKIGMKCTFAMSMSNERLDSLLTSIGY